MSMSCTTLPQWLRRLITKNNSGTKFFVPIVWFRCSNTISPAHARVSHRVTLIKCVGNPHCVHPWLSMVFAFFGEVWIAVDLSNCSYRFRWVALYSNRINNVHHFIMRITDLDQLSCRGLSLMPESISVSGRNYLFPSEWGILWSNLHDKPHYWFRSFRVVQAILFLLTLSITVSLFQPRKILFLKISSRYFENLFIRQAS